MRLTLRTLLAWIDEMLPADDQRALGEKVAASGVAAQLVGRIQRAVERAELPAPAVVGKGLADDANTVAEFLDNTLPGEKLEAFERVCIDSDIHLAEAAACHRLLAEMNRDPEAVHSQPNLRSRLLACVAEHAPPPSRGVQHEESVAIVRDLRAAVDAASRSAAGRRRPVGAWVSALVAVVLLLVLGGILVFALVRSKGRDVAVKAGGERRRDARALEPPAAAQTGTAPEPAAGSDPPRLSEPASPALPAPTPAVPAAASVPVGGSPPVAAPPVANQPLPADEAPEAAADAASGAEPPAVAPPAVAPQAPPPAAAVPTERLVPQGDALAIVGPAAGRPAPAAAAAVPGPNRDLPPAGDAAGQIPAAAASFVAGDILLRRAAGQGDPEWVAVGRGGRLSDREDLIAPPWCRPQIRFGAALIRLEPNTRAVLGRDADGTPRLEVVFGRAVAWSETAELKLGVTAGGLVGQATAAPRQPLGIEVSLDREPDADPAASHAQRRAVVATSDGAASWRQTEADGAAAAKPLAGIAGQVPLAPRVSLTWDDGDPGAATLGPPGVEPAWMRGAPTTDRTEGRAVKVLAERLAPEAPVQKPLEAIAENDPWAENRIAAAATLALLGDYEPAVMLLCAPVPSPQGLTEAQWTTLENLTVPLALARGVNAAAKLGQAFEKRGPAGSGKSLFAMARGLPADDLANGGDARLVEALSAEELVVRRYAIRNLMAILPPADRDRFAYRADRKPDLNREAVAWWKTRLEQGSIRRDAPPDDAAAP
jgi:hypothetical protein